MFTYGRSNVFWTNGTIEQVGANWLNAGAQLFSGTFGRGMTIGITRVSNVMQYTSPTFSGINLVVSVSPQSEAAAAGTNTDGIGYGFTAQGTHGPFAWGFDWFTALAATPGATATSPGQQSTTGTKVRAAFRYMPDGQIAVLGLKTEVDKGGFANGTANATGLVATCNTAATGCALEQTGYGVSWDHMFGPWQPIIQYYQIAKITGSGCNATGAGVVAGITPGTQCNLTEATQITAAIRYVFSKRTHAYISYNKIDNDAQYNQDFNGASITARNGAANQFVAADPTIVAVGMIHNF
jgi:predicted porin